MEIQFDYHPFLRIDRDAPGREVEAKINKLTIGLVPSHASISFVAGNLRHKPDIYRICAHAIGIELTGTLSDQLATSRMAASVMEQFSGRAYRTLSGLYYAAKVQEPPKLATFMRRLAVVLERGEPTEPYSTLPELLLHSAILERIEIEKHRNDVTRMELINKGIAILYEIVERDANNALWTLEGVPINHEQDWALENAGNVPEVVVGIPLIDVNALKGANFNAPKGGFNFPMVELPDDLLEAMQ
jgi:hypothetical protein